MTAKEVPIGKWFTKSDGDPRRVYQRLEGDEAVIDGKTCIVAKPLQPTLRMPAFYMPSDQPVELYHSNSIRIA